MMQQQIDHQLVVKIHAKKGKQVTEITVTSRRGEEPNSSMNESCVILSRANYPLDSFL